MNQPNLQHVDDITERLIEPLNDRTRQLFKRVNIESNDRMRVRLDEEGKRFVVKLYSISQWNPDREYSPSWRASRFPKRIPERKYLPQTGEWVLAATDFTALVLNAAWPKRQIEFTEDACVVYDFLLARFVRQSQSAKVYADYKMSGTIPEMPLNFVDHPSWPLMDFQKVGFAGQVNTEGGNLWMEQGTGKTPIVIARVNYEAHRVYEEEKRMYRCLAIVPKNMRTGWLNKFCKFAVRPGKVTVLRGGQLTRVKLLVEAFKQDEDSEYTVVVVSYEGAVRSWNALRMVQWDLCCLDEAHMIKSPNTRRWKYVEQLRELCNNRTGLTGTPFANHLFDAWTQLEWLGEGLSGFTNYRAFRSYYGKFVRQDGFDRLVGYNNLPVLQERISRLCFMVTREEAMPYLPKKTYDVLEVEMAPKQREYYVTLQKQLMIEIENELADAERENKQLTATHILTKLLRLSQITAGYLKWDAQWSEDGELLNADDQVEVMRPNPKVEGTVEFIKNTESKDKVIVWSNWVPSIKELSERFREEGIKHVVYYGATKDKDRDEAERSYNQDADVKVFLGNPAAGGVGLDLWGHWPDWDGTERDHGCDTRYVLYYSQNWSMIHRSQSEDRSMRRGTRAPVQVIDVVVPGTIDEEIACRVLGKKMQAMQLQDVREIMQKILETAPTEGDE